MSRTLHFGRDILDDADVDVEDLLAMLSPKDIQAMVDEMAADPDDKHLPASVRTAYRLNITFIRHLSSFDFEIVCIDVIITLPWDYF